MPVTAAGVSVTAPIGANVTDIVQMSTAQFSAYSADEIVKWGRVVKQAGIKAQ